MTLTSVGWFDCPEQTSPAHDPGLDVSCPICSRPLHEQPRKTISLMPWEVQSDKSYFFRAHKPCWDAASETIRVDIENEIIDSHWQKPS